MVIYIDVLVSINIIIDYFLIGLTSFILKSKCSFSRQLLGAVIGGLCSIAILIPIENVFLNIFLKCFLSFLVVMTAYGFNSLKLFIRRVITFFIASFIFSGCVWVVVNTFNVSNLKVKNGIIYYDLSALVLVLITGITYFLLTFIMKYINRNKVLTCKLRIEDGNSSLEITALVDSGNKLKEPFSEKYVLILDSKYSDILKGVNKAHRIIPYKTMDGTGIITGFCPDKIYYLGEDGEECLDMYIGFSPGKLENDYSAIISADAI